MGAFSVSSMYQAPGFREIADQTVEEILVHPEAMFKVGVQLAAGYPVIKVGDVLSMLTTGINAGKYRRYGSASLNAAYVTGDSVFVLKDGLGNIVIPPFLPGEIVTIGAQASKTITAVNSITGAITIAGTLGGSEAAGAVVKLTTTDGSDVAACIAARPVQSSLYDPASPNLNPLLDQDYLIDGIWQGILKRSKLRGLDAAAITSLSAQSLAVWMDAVIIR